MKYYLMLCLFAFTVVITACNQEQKAETETTELTLQKVNASTNYLDPVCQMKVDENAKLTHSHEGVVYGFCGKGCKDAFEKDPTAFLAGIE